MIGRGVLVVAAVVVVAVQESRVRRVEAKVERLRRISLHTSGLLVIQSGVLTQLVDEWEGS